MLEVFVCIVHADSFHNGAGSQIEDCSERDDLQQRKPLKADADGATRRLGGEPFAPMSSSKAPADLYARGERENAARNRKTGEADEGFRFAHFNGPVAPATLYKL